MFGEDHKVVSVVLLEDLEPRLDHQWVDTWQKKSETGEGSAPVMLGLRTLRDGNHHDPGLPALT